MDSIEESNGTVVVRRNNGPDVIFTASGYGYLPSQGKNSVSGLMGVPK